ncbi:hypothetical protein QVN42_04330 [Yersinia nurmii]|uniref:Phage protein n=1 Tax=Yersinia nurmii TaxID=685706 RepID=A0AAW7JVH4_9GAMM|nr:hypothetical protein [Yersinia nurmii]MDN0086629.1 hypothetical protein [Yersinia nurmii]CNE55542.1 phage protein [Yersinia nurmii]
MKKNKLELYAFGLVMVIGTFSTSVLASPLMRLQCLTESGIKSESLLDGPNQQLTIDGAIFKFTEIKNDANGERLFFQRTVDNSTFHAALNISTTPIYLDVNNGEKTLNFTCKSLKA